MKIETYPDREMLAIDVANLLAGELENCLLQHDTASFAVPGGTTPGPIFDALCAADLDWSRVHVMLTDERWVAPDHPRSNAALVRERLLVDRAAQAHFVPFYRAGQTPQEAAADLAQALDPELPISVLLLGMGADMHTASLFPGAEGLERALASDAPALCPIVAPGQPEPRMTLSARVLNDAMSKHLVIFGEDKRDAIDRAARLPPEEAPINAVMDEGVVHWAA